MNPQCVHNGMHWTVGCGLLLPYKSVHVGASPIQQIHSPHYRIDGTVQWNPLLSTVLVLSNNLHSPHYEIHGTIQLLSTVLALSNYSTVHTMEYMGLSSEIHSYPQPIQQSILFHSPHYGIHGTVQWNPLLSTV